MNLELVMMWDVCVAPSWLGCQSGRLQSYLGEGRDQPCPVESSEIRIIVTASASIETCVDESFS